MNPAYTRALPVSLSATITSMGTAMTRTARMKSLNRPILKFCWLSTKASSREVVILDISAGWNLTGPSSNHEWEPLTSLDTKMTRTSSPSTARYMGMGSASQILGGMINRISPPRPSAVSIHTNCFPLRALQAKMEEGPVEWIEA